MPERQSHTHERKSIFDINAITSMIRDVLSMHFQKLYAAESDCCVICRSEASNQVLLPCKHVCACRECLKMIKKECPMCRTPFNISFEI